MATAADSTATRFPPWVYPAARWAAALALPAAFVPWLVAYGREIWALEHYQFVPLAVLAALAILARDVRAFETQRHDITGEPRPEPSPAAFATLAALSVVWLGMAIMMQSPWHAAIGSVLLLAAAVAAIGGWWLMARTAPVWCLLALSIQLPLDADNLLIRWLQGITVHLAGALLDWLGITHLVSGNLIHVSGQRLLVEEACSGVQSFFSGLAFAIIYLAWRQRGWVASLVVLASVPAWVLLTNALRVTVITVLAVRWNIPVFEGWRHDLLGMLIFTLTLLLIASTDYVVHDLPWLAMVVVPKRLRLKKPRRVIHDPYARPEGDDSEVALGNRWWRAPLEQLRRPAIAACGVLLLLLPMGFAITGMGPRDTAVPIAMEVPLLGAELLPKQVGDWQLVNFEPLERRIRAGIGTSSQVWTYRNSRGGLAAVSLDYPYAGWHEVTVCYLGEGWSVDRRQVRVQPIDTSGTTSTVTEVSLYRPLEGMHGYLLFDLFDPGNRPIYTGGDPMSLLSRFLRRATRWRDRWSKQGPTWQVQLFAETADVLDDRDRASLESLFQTARRAIGEQNRLLASRT